MTGTIPEKPALEGLEATWGKNWEDQGTSHFRRDQALERGRDNVFAIDTPPPTASGSLHIGHVFSYTHMDLQARYSACEAKRFSIRWAGMTTGFPPNAGCNIITA